VGGITGYEYQKEGKLNTCDGQDAGDSNFLTLSIEGRGCVHVGSEAFGPWAVGTGSWYLSWGYGDDPLAGSETYRTTTSTALLSM